MATNYRTMREIASVRKGLTAYQREVGQTVLWYEFDAANTTSNAVYSEGPSRKWKPPRPVHCLFVMYYESDISPDVSDEGFYRLDHIHLTIAADQFSSDGVTDSLSADEHERDRISYENDFYEVRKFRLRGRTADSYMVVTVDAVQVTVDDMELDVPMAGTTWGQLKAAGTTWAQLTAAGTTWKQLHG